MCERCFLQIYLGVTLKNKIVKTDFHGFVEIADESNCIPNKLWVDQGREFYNNLMQNGQMTKIF